jgi:hypothetical protein
MLVEGVEPWSPWFHTNVLAIKPPHHFVNKFDIEWILHVSLNFHEFFCQCV